MRLCLVELRTTPSLNSKVRLIQSRYVIPFEAERFSTFAPSKKKASCYLIRLSTILVKSLRNRFVTTTLILIAVL